MALISHRIVVDGKTIVFTLQKIIVGTPPASQQSIAGECSFEAKKSVVPTGKRNPVMALVVFNAESVLVFKKS